MVEVYRHMTTVIYLLITTRDSITLLFDSSFSFSFFLFFGPFDLWERGGDGRCVRETGEVIAYVAVVHAICSLQHATHRFLASWEVCGFVSKYKRKAIAGMAFCSSFILY